MRSDSIVQQRRKDFAPVPQHILQVWKNARRQAAMRRDPLYDSAYNQKKIAMLREFCELLQAIGRKPSDLLTEVKR
jgi:hypothetical protein